MFFIRQDKKTKDENKKRLNTELKYVKLYDWIKTRIYMGKFRIDEKLPSEAMLCKKFEISRQTVRTALEVLEKEGFIWRKKGSGTYVAYELSKSENSNKSVGLLLSYCEEYIFPYIFSGIETVLSRHKIGIDIAVTRNRINNETVYLERMLNSNVSGIIIEGTKSAFPNPNINLYNALAMRNIPIIFLHNYYTNIQNYDSILMDDEQCAFMLTQQLIDNGHKNIAGVFKYDDLQGVRRYKGFLKCMAQNMLKINDEWIKWYSTEDFQDSFSNKRLSEFRKRASNCSAVVAYNDTIAEMVLKFLESKGLCVPDDVSIVSFDDTYIAKRSSVRLVSAIHPKADLGKRVAMNMVKMIGDEQWKKNDYSYVFEPQISGGDSIKDIR